MTKLRYELPEQSNVNVVIYALLGKQANTLSNQTQLAESKTVIWHGTKDSGKPVSAGVYFYTIQIGNITQTNKMILLI